MKYWGAFIAGLMGLLLLVSLTLLRQREVVEEAPNHAQPADRVAAAARDEAMRSEAVADRSDAVQDPAAIDLRSASPTFRNSTLLTAIRRAGFYCADVVSAHESADGVWVASCSDMRGLPSLELFPGQRFGLERKDGPTRNSMSLDLDGERAV